MGIGRRVKERRKELGLTVAEVAKAAGLRPTTLYDLEREEQHSTTRLHALCKVLGLNPEWVESGRGIRLTSHATVPPVVVRNDQKETTTLHGMQITTEEVEFGIEWGKLDEPARSLIREQVMLMVASQVRKRRTRSAADDDPKASPKTSKHN